MFAGICVAVEQSTWRVCNTIDDRVTLCCGLVQDQRLPRISKGKASLWRKCSVATCAMRRPDILTGYRPRTGTDDVMQQRATFFTSYLQRVLVELAEGSPVMVRSMVSAAED